MKFFDIIRIFTAIILLLLCNCSSPNNNDDEKDNPSIDGWKLVWQDEFNESGEIDSEKWEQPEYNRRNNDNGPDGWWLKENAYLDGQGNLVIRANQINNRNQDNDPFDYATGMVRSFNHFRQVFGKFEIRCQLPKQPGWWVAFWLMSPTVANVDDSGEDGTEIDIMEGFGWTDNINHALHWDGYGEDLKSDGKLVNIPGIREGFHTFTLEWTRDEYIFFVDSTETWRSSAGGVSKVPAYVKITGELSTLPGLSGIWWANDPATGNFPDYFLVDYVRVYQRVE